MIVSDTYEFAFVHIPKCAGTTVRAVLERYDETPGPQALGLEPHPTHENIFDLPGVGYVDFHHLPLQALALAMPEQLDKLRRYDAVTIVREPHDRLVSAFAEHMKRYRKTPLQNLSTAEIEEWLGKILAQVGEAFSASPILPHEFVHFQPQADYIDLDGERVVSNIFPISDMAGFEAMVHEHFQRRGETPESFAASGSNVSVVHRSEFSRRLIEGNRSLIRTLGRLVPNKQKVAMRKLVYAKRQDRFADLAASDAVKQFVRRYTPADLELWNAQGGHDGR